jgi:hypothetical protein
MGIELSDLPEKYRRIALAQMGGRKKPPKITEEIPPGKGGKYHAVKETRGAITFDSRKEARRYDALVVMLRCGEIEDLRVQPEFTLIEAYTTPEGEKIRAMRYRADFSYRKQGQLIVEDVKSAATRTRVYLDKRKLMREKYGIDVVEVQEW